MTVLRTLVDPMCSRQQATASVAVWQWNSISHRCSWPTTLARSLGVASRLQRYVYSVRYSTGSWGVIQ